MAHQVSTHAVGCRAGVEDDSVGQLGGGRGRVRDRRGYRWVSSNCFALLYCMMCNRPATQGKI